MTTMSPSERSKIATEYRVSTFGRTTWVVAGVASVVDGTRKLTVASETARNALASSA